MLVTGDETLIWHYQFDIFVASPQKVFLLHRFSITAMPMTYPNKDLILSCSPFRTFIRLCVCFFSAKGTEDIPTKMVAESAITLNITGSSHKANLNKVKKVG